MNNRVGRFGCSLDGDQSQVMFLDRVMEEVAIDGQVGLVDESCAQHFVIIAIAWDQVERRFQWRQQQAQLRIFIGLAVLHRITGEDHRIGPLLVDVCDTSPQAVGPQLCCGMIRRRRQDVGIADLGD